MQKRSGLGRIGLAVILSATMILVGCSTHWIGEAEQIVAVMIPAAENLVTLVSMLEGKTVTAGDLAMVQSAGTQAGSDLQLIQSLIAAYDKADDAAKPGLLSQIQSALNAVQANLQGLLPALHIKDAVTQTKVAAVVAILLSEVQSLAAVVPVGQGSGVSDQGPAAARLSKAMTTAAGTAGGKGKLPLSAREFAKSYNATLTAKTGNADLDRATSGLQIHEHGAAARWASAGLLK